MNGNTPWEFVLLHHMTVLAMHHRTNIAAWQIPSLVTKESMSTRTSCILKYLNQMKKYPHKLINRMEEEARVNGNICGTILYPRVVNDIYGAACIHSLEINSGYIHTILVVCINGILG